MVNMSDIEVAMTTVAIVMASVIIYIVLKFRKQKAELKDMVPKSNSRALGVCESMWTIAHDLAGRSTFWVTNNCAIKQNLSIGNLKHVQFYRK